MTKKETLEKINLDDLDQIASHVQEEIPKSKDFDIETVARDREQDKKLAYELANQENKKIASAFKDSPAEAQEKRDAKLFHKYQSSHFFDIRGIDPHFLISAIMLTALFFFFNSKTFAELMAKIEPAQPENSYDILNFANLDILGGMFIGFVKDAIYVYKYGYPILLLTAFAVLQRRTKAGIKLTHTHIETAQKFEDDIYNTRRVILRWNQIIFYSEKMKNATRYLELLNENGRTLGIIRLDLWRKKYFTRTLKTYLPPNHPLQKFTE